MYRCDAGTIFSYPQKPMHSYERTYVCMYVREKECEQTVALGRNDIIAYDEGRHEAEKNWGAHKMKMQRRFPATIKTRLQKWMERERQRSGGF